jgi:2-methylisocitrate lyase-like PEP mutase family enzyme
VLLPREDQVGAKRCGHRPVNRQYREIFDQVKAAADAKNRCGFFLIARTDAIQAGVDAC